MSTIPNTTPVPNVLIDRYMPKLSDTAFRLAVIIVRKTYGWLLDPVSGMRKQEDWISYSQLMDFSGRKRQAVSMALRELEEMGLVDIRDIHGKRLITIDDRRGKKLMYRFTTSMKSELDNSNQYDNQTLKIKHTKETYTKALSKDNGGDVSKRPSCPLLNGSSLVAQYGRGHDECVEYLTSTIAHRGFSFVNRPKQFKALHNILRAGFGFDHMNKVIPLMDKRYGKGNWDFMTMASFIEKGAGNGNN